MKHTTIAGVGLLILAITVVVSPASAQTAAGWTFTILADGGSSQGSLVQGTDGNFYGSSKNGGNGGGAVFKITPSGTFTTLYAFPYVNGNFPYGAYPSSCLVVGHDGNLYGDTGNGVYKLTTDGTAADTSLNWLYNCPSGVQDDLIQGTDGNLYGTTVNGGANSHGTVYSITTAGALNWSYSLAGMDGQGPRGRLVEGRDGNFYGTANGGGLNGRGTVFKITAAGAFTKLWDFSWGTIGTNPYDGLAQGADGNYYGTTSYSGAYSHGAVFKLATDGTAAGTKLTTLYSFNPANGTDGGMPLAGLIQGSDGNFYGTSWGGTTYNVGTVFKITPSGTLTTLHSFSLLDVNFENVDGWELYSCVVQGSDGSLYGTAFAGGPYTDGTVFKLTPPAASTYVLWNNSGTASLWNIPATGSAATATFGPTAGWSPNALTSDTSGNAYILWTCTTGAAAVWKISSSLKDTVRQAFGPYTGWTAKSITVGPDGHVHLLWNGPSNGASIFNIVLGSSFTSQAYSPPAGCQAAQIAVDSGNNTRVLLNNTSTNATSLWNITSGGTVTSQTFGPYAGYKAQNLVAGPANLPRIIWNYTPTNAAALWQILPLGNETSTVLGAFTGWAATGIAVNGDGDSDVLWTNASTGQASIWDVTSSGTHTSTSYGPYSGWKAIAIAPGP